LAFEDETDRRRKPEPPAHPDGEENFRSGRKRRTTPEVGHALRAAYQQTVSEDIPPEMLDLLGKLG
jgi:hypothetical protein